MRRDLGCGDRIGLPSRSETYFQQSRSETMANCCRLTAIATTAALGLSAFAALAAPPVAGDPTAPPAAKMQPSRGHMKFEGIEQRIADLHAKLKITPEQ